VQSAFFKKKKKKKKAPLAAAGAGVKGASSFAIEPEN